MLKATLFPAEKRIYKYLTIIYSFKLPAAHPLLYSRYQKARCTPALTSGRSAFGGAVILPGPVVGILVLALLFGFGVGFNDFPYQPVAHHIFGLQFYHYNTLHVAQNMNSFD